MESKIRSSFMLRQDKSPAVKRQLALYEDDSDSEMPTISTFLKSFSGFGTEEHEGKSAKLGTIFGVYLPSIQHILGVQMFLRLLWIVGIAGVVQSFAMTFLCCLCTFLTSISISAIATNGKVESGGTYFMISRNLGPEFGGAIGVLFFLANAVATSMYLVGGVEILLVYMAPNLPKFGDGNAAHGEEMFNDCRVYGSAFLFLIFVICCLGVRFVQFAAPVSLACMILSILAVFIGAFVATEQSSPKVCTLGAYLFDTAYVRGGNDHDSASYGCNKSAFAHLFCITKNSTHEQICDNYFASHEVKTIAAIPGFNGITLNENLKSNYMRKGESTPSHQGLADAVVVQDMTTSFFVLMAIFFPSVTGIMTGANMSGDLRDPQLSIPSGTIAATLTTSFVYLSLIIVYGGSISGMVLRDKFGVSLGGRMLAAELAWPSEWLLLVGSFTSCLGAGLQCLCSAPRLLQSIAKDDLIPFLSPFRRVTKHNEPFRALLFATFIAECAILIGGIDYIAPVVDLFFLLSYCFVNLACALQTFLNTPNWRPRFRFYHWSLAMLGAVLNLFIMFSTYWHYALVALAMCSFLYKYIEYKGAKQEWGDGIRGLALTTAQYSLLRIEGSHPGTKHWRPQLLVYVNSDDVDESETIKIMHFASQLKAGRGLTMVASFIKGELISEELRRKADALKMLQRSMKSAKVKGFTEVVVSTHAPQNVDTLLQCVGMGSLRPNTFVLGWPEGWRTTSTQEPLPQCAQDFMEILCRVVRARKCVIVAKGLVLFPFVRDQLAGTIDIWMLNQDGGLLMFLAYLLQQHRVWRACKLRIFITDQLGKNFGNIHEEMYKWISNQIRATVHVINSYEENANSLATNGAQETRRPEEKVDNEASDGRTTASPRGGFQKDENEMIIIADNCCSAPEMVANNMDGHEEASALDNKPLRLEDAQVVNKFILNASLKSRLIVLALPQPPADKTSWPDYLHYIDTLTKDMSRVLMANGTGTEVL